MIDVAALASRDTFARDLGIELVEASPGRAVTRVTVTDRQLNFNGSGHGGLTFTLADIAFGLACNARGTSAAGIDAHIVYSRAVKAGDVLTATAVEIARSTKLGTYRVDVVRDDGKRIAAMTGTAFIGDVPVEV